MTSTNWQLKFPVSSVIFDCDGTLTTLEGIDVLAEHNNVGDKVTALTREAMGHSGMNIALYEKRLQLVNPTQDQIKMLGEEYFVNRVQDIFEVIQLFKRLNKSVYIVSAGLYPALKIFGELLQIPAKNVMGVDIQFDSAGKYIDFDRTSPLVNTNGKRVLVKKIKNPGVFVGDGLNDIEAKDLVTRFIGYGGNFYREIIASQCQFYINTKSLAALLPLSLTLDEVLMLTDDEKTLYAKGMADIQQGQVKIDL